MKKLASLFFFALFVIPFFFAQTPPAKPGVEEHTDEVFKVVDEPPVFPGCETFEDFEEKRKCAGEKMVEFIYSNLKYPDEALASGIEGTVYIMYTVEKDGSITNIDVVRHLGAGTREESIRVIQMMPKWEPGMKDGKIVRTQFNLPIKFNLSPTRKKKKGN